MYLNLESWIQCHEHINLAAVWWLHVIRDSLTHTTPRAPFTDKDCLRLGYVWISDHTHCFLLDVINHSCPNFLGGFVNLSTPRQNGCHFADDIFKCIFMNEKVCILNRLSLKFVPKGLIDDIPTLVQIMAWRRWGDKPLSEPMLIQFTEAYMRH